MIASLMIQVLDALPLGVLAMDLGGRILFFNRAARELLQSRVPVGRPFSDLEEENHAMRDFLTNVRSGDKRVADLFGRQVLLRYTDLVRADAQREGAVVTLEDIGETDSVENIRRSFSTDAAHELKTPLTSIRGYAECIETGIAKGDAATGAARKILAQADRMQALIADILTVQQLDAGQFEQLNAAADADLDLFAITRDTLNALEELARSYGINVVLTGSRTPVRGNLQLLSSLVKNLVENAVRYNRPNGSVYVNVYKKVLTVRDTGIGIPQNEIPHVYERFYRLDKSRSKEKGGTGLGLSIVKHACKYHHAKIDIESNETKGTTVTVTFP
ncbi:MAG: ATP-binding protein [Clostridiales bacterium]|nr:ATP-binding protein [Clostridiales bacterium]